MPEPTPRPGASIDAGQLLDEGGWGAYQKWLVLLTALTIIFDGIDNQLLGIAIPSIMRDWGVARAAFAPVVSLGYLGMMIGGATAGLAGDRFGRRTALLASMATFAAMTFAIALVHNVSSLGALRFVAGIGLGGAMPNAATLAAEFVPFRRRAFAVTITIVCMPVGATIAGLLGIQALARYGWSTLFLAGGAIPLAATALLVWLLPESPRYLARHRARWSELVSLLRRMGQPVAPSATFVDSSEKGNDTVPVRVLFGSEFRHDTVALWGSFYSCLLAVYLGFSWLPSLLSGAGFDAATSSSGITFFNLGGVVGAIAGGLAIPRVGSRTAMLYMAGGAIVGALGLSAMTIQRGSGVLPILAMLTLTGGLVNAVQTTMYALATNVYPSAVRATGVGAAVAIGRLGSITSGYAGAWAIDYYGTHSFFALMAGAMAICFVALATVRRHVLADVKNGHNRLSV